MRGNYVCSFMVDPLACPLKGEDVGVVIGVTDDTPPEVEVQVYNDDAISVNRGKLEDGLGGTFRTVEEATRYAAALLCSFGGKVHVTSNSKEWCEEIMRMFKKDLYSAMQSRRYP